MTLRTIKLAALAALVPGLLAVPPAATSAGAATTTGTTTTCTSGCSVPFDAASAWNRPIPTDVALDPHSSALVAAISDNGLPLTSDPTQYSPAVYLVDSGTSQQNVSIKNYFSTYDSGDASRVGYGWAPTISGVPIPAGATAPAGSDGQVILWDPRLQTEWEFWQFGRDSRGRYYATNGVRYHTSNGYYGRFADGKAGRGAGLPYLAGLVRPWEIASGAIHHALAFAYHAPAGTFVYPASKSDGAKFGGVTGVDLPEGSRLQLDPSITDAQFKALGISGSALVIAHALQTYGMIVVDNSGSSKIYLQSTSTASWPSDVSRTMLSALPWSRFRVVQLTQ